MPEFGTTPLLSSFDCPAENPLYEDGQWAQTTPDRPPLLKGGVNCDASDSAHGLPNFSHWVAQAFSGNIVEVWGCAVGGQLGAANETWRVGLFTRTGSNLQGYRFYYGGGIAKFFNMAYYTGGGINSLGGLGQTGGIPGGYPDRIGLRVIGDQVEGWAMYGGVWILQLTATDTQFRGPMYPGLAIEDDTGGGLGWTCFGGGVVNRTQIYRIVRGH